MTSEIDEIRRSGLIERDLRTHVDADHDDAVADLQRYCATLLRVVDRLRGCGEIDNPLCITVYPHEVYDPSGVEWKARAEAAEREVEKLRLQLSGTIELGHSTQRKLAKVLDDLKPYLHHHQPTYSQMGCASVMPTLNPAEKRGPCTCGLEAIIKEARDE